MWEVYVLLLKNCLDVLIFSRWYYYYFTINLLFVYFYSKFLNFFVYFFYEPLTDLT